LDSFFFYFGEKIFPGTIMNARSEKRGMKVLGKKGAPRKSRSVGNVELERERSEEKELGFEVFDGGSRGFHEIIKNFFKGSSLSGRWGSHEHCFINKLVMVQWISHAMKREATDITIFHHHFDIAT
jgi:hypothetical protein